MGQRRRPRASPVRWRRWIVFGILLAALATGATLALRGLVLREAGAALARRGCTAADLRMVLASLRAEDIRCPGLSIAALEASRWPREIVLREADLDLLQLEGLRGQGAGQPQGEALAGGLLATARIEGLRLRLGERVLGEGLQGDLQPLALKGPDLELNRQEGLYQLRMRRQLRQPPLLGEVSLVLDWDPATGSIQGRLAATDLTLRHELLSSEALPGLVALGTIEGEDGGLRQPRLRGTLELGGPQADWSASWDAQAGLAIEAELRQGALATQLEPLAPLLPELRRARVEGRASGKLAWSQQGGLVIQPQLEGLSVEGAVDPSLPLDWGAFTYRALDEQGEPFPRRSGEGSPGWTPLGESSPHLVNALQAAEDSAFMRHRGYDMQAIREALDADLEAGQVLRGGSTITQQLAKNLFLDGDQTLQRKLRELLLSAELDRDLGKKRVLELYLNIVEWGPGLHGVAAASERYFMKRPARLNPREAAFLAALLPSPRRYYRSWYLAERPNRTRIDAILDNMVDGEWLSAHQAARWKRARLTLVPPP